MARDCNDGLIRETFSSNRMSVHASLAGGPRLIMERSLNLYWSTRRMSFRGVLLSAHKPIGCLDATAEAEPGG